MINVFKFAGILFLSASLAAPLAAQQAYTVLPDGSGDFPTIQAALTAVASGDTVLLGDGVFAGAGNRDLDFGGKAITLRGRGADARLCVIECGGAAGDPHRGFDFQGGEGPGTVVEHVTVRGGWADNGGAIRLGTYAVVGASPTLRDCIFADNRAGNDGGAVWAAWESNPVVSDCLFSGNRALRFGAGFGSDFWSQPTLTRCTFVDNVCEDVGYSDGGAVYISATASPVSIYGCLLWENTAQMGDQIGSQNHGMIAVDCCDIQGGLAGIHFENPSDLVWGADNIDADPLFCSAATGEFALRVDSPCAPGASGCGRRGAYGVGCYGEIVVEADGSGDFATIQAAIDAAGTGDVILLADGEFVGDGNRDLDFRGKAITVRGRSADARLCVMTCGGSALTPHRGVSFQGGEGPATVLEHLTIRGGWADYGGAILLGTYAAAGASPTIRYCIIDANRAEDHGGGIWAAYASNPLISHCLFTDNHAVRFGGAFGSDFWSLPRVESCTFAGNVCEDPDSGDGGAVYVSATASPVELNACILWGNRAALGAEIGLQNGAMLSLACSDVRGGLGGVHLEPGTVLNVGSGVIDASPLFCYQVQDDFRLGAGSPCLPPGNICGVQMGCYGQGCLDVSATPGAPPPAAYLAANRPNPFNPSTRIGFGLAAPAPVSLEIYDLAGRLVRRLVSGDVLPAGDHVRDWDGCDDAGRALASGVYVYRISTGNLRDARRMLLLR